MSSYDGGHSLESYLEYETFYRYVFDEKVVPMFEQYRERIERWIDVYLSSDHGDGLPSWRDYRSHGIASMTEAEEDVFESIVLDAESMLQKRSEYK